MSVIHTQEMSSLFTQSFWETDYCGTHGFEVLVKRMKDGKRTCIDMEEYIHQRATLEEKYGRDLIALARKPGAKEEIGTLKESWIKLKEETEAIGQYHLNIANKCRIELESKVKDFYIRTREERKKSEEAVRRSQAHKKKCFDNHNRCKNNYDNRCREHDRAEELALNQQNTKEVERLNLKYRKAKDSVEISDHQYNDAVTTLEDSRHHWEREYEICCAKFQALEEERIDFSRNILWIYSNVFSQSCCFIDERMEQFRTILEKCNVDKDIGEFVLKNRTGYERPSEIFYQNFYQPKSNKLQSFSRPLPKPPSESTSIDIDTDNFFNETDTYSAPQDVTTIGKTFSPHYDSLKKRLKILYDYESQGELELTLKAGDFVVVYHKEDQIWSFGKSSDGKEGVFPSSFVESF